MARGHERKCGVKRKHIGLLVHDLRRSAAKRLRESGIHEKLIMDIGGWKTRSMFNRCTITGPEAMRRAMAVVTAPMLPYSPRQPTWQNDRKGGYPVKMLIFKGLWCPEGDLNPHVRLSTADFKSAASASFAIRAAEDSIHGPAKSPSPSMACPSQFYLRPAATALVRDPSASS